MKIVTWCVGERMGFSNISSSTLKDDLKDEAQKENQEEEDVNLTTHEHERALKGAYIKRSIQSFVMSGKPITDIDSYPDQSKPLIKTLIEN